MEWVVFDILNDGVPVTISWTAPGSTNALLVLDRNGNGSIDNGPNCSAISRPSRLGNPKRLYRARGI